MSTPSWQAGGLARFALANYGGHIAALSIRLAAGSITVDPAYPCGRSCQYEALLRRTARKGRKAIEEAFSKVKRLLSKTKARTRKGLIEAVGVAISRFRLRALGGAFRGNRITLPGLSSPIFGPLRDTHFRSQQTTGNHRVSVGRSFRYLPQRN